MTLRLTLAVLAVQAVLFVVPLVFYGIGSRFVVMPSPERVAPWRFLVGVFVTKLGTAFALVAVFWLSRDAWADGWLAYAAIWFAMFAASEVGDVISGRSTVAEAVIGVASELFYAPLAVWIAAVMLR